jgi:hypothetical protein
MGTGHVVFHSTLNSGRPCGNTGASSEVSWGDIDRHCDSTITGWVSEKTGIRGSGCHTLKWTIKSCDQKSVSLEKMSNLREFMQPDWLESF